MQLAQPLLENGYPALREEQRGGDQTKNLFLGYSSSMELVGGQLSPVRCGQVAFTNLGTGGVTAAPREVGGLPFGSFFQTQEPGSPLE